MPIDPLLANHYRNVAQVPVPDFLGTLGQVQGLQRGRQQLTLGELGIAEHQQQAQQQQAAQQALQGAVGPAGTVDYGQAQSNLARAGNLGAMATIGKLQASQGAAAENQAQALERRMKAHVIGTDWTHAGMTAVQENPALYEPVLRQLYAQFRDAGLEDNARGVARLYEEHPTYNADIVAALVATTRNEKLRLQALESTRMGTQPIYGTDEFGQPAVAQLHPQGGLEVAHAPGFRPSAPGAIPVPRGTGTQIYDRGGNPLTGIIPKDVATPAREAAQATGEGKTAGEQQPKARAAQDAMASLEVKHATLLTAIETAKQAVGASRFASGLVGKALPFNQPRENLTRALERVTANLGLDELVTLKTTGGASLGQVTEAEHRLLQSIIATLSADLDGPTLLRELDKLGGELAKRKVLRERAYQRDFGGVQTVGPLGGALPTSPAQEGAAPETTTPQALPRGMQKGIITEDRVRKLMQSPNGQSHGMTRDEAILILQNRGYQR